MSGHPGMLSATLTLNLWLVTEESTGQGALISNVYLNCTWRLPHHLKSQWTHRLKLDLHLPISQAFLQSSPWHFSPLAELWSCFFPRVGLGFVFSHSCTGVTHMNSRPWCYSVPQMYTMCLESKTEHKHNFGLYYKDSWLSLDVLGFLLPHSWFVKTCVLCLCKEQYPTSWRFLDCDVW